MSKELNFKHGIGINLQADEHDNSITIATNILTDSLDNSEDNKTHNAKCVNKAFNETLKSKTTTEPVNTESKDFWLALGMGIYALEGKGMAFVVGAVNSDKTVFMIEENGLIATTRVTSTTDTITWKRMISIDEVPKSFNAIKVGDKTISAED